MSNGPDQNRAPSDGNQEPLFTVRNIVLVMLGLVVMIGFVLLGSSLISTLARPSPQVVITITPPEPRLQADPPQELRALKATQMAQISTYGWINRDAGVVHIPIDRAMDLYLERIEADSTPRPPDTPAPGATPDPVERGEVLFTDLGCQGCHSGEPGAVGPELRGLFGEQVVLASGEEVTADEAYIRESILRPDAKIVAGYQAVMPSFEGQVSEEELSALVAYIRSLGN